MSLMKLARIFLAFLMGLAAILSGWAQTYTVLYSFTGGVDGASPKGGLVLDAAGNLYGTTQGTNPYPYLQTTGTTAGSVFKISAGGQFTLLYNFAAGGANENFFVGDAHRLGERPQKFLALADQVQRGAARRARAKARQARQQLNQSFDFGSGDAFSHANPCPGS